MLIQSPNYTLTTLSGSVEPWFAVLEHTRNLYPEVLSLVIIQIVVFKVYIVMLLASHEY